MAIVKLEVPSPVRIYGNSADPEPDWTFETLLSELDSIQKKIDGSSSVSLPSSKTKSRKKAAKNSSAFCFPSDIRSENPKSFVMRAFDGDIRDDEIAGEDGCHEGVETAWCFNYDLCLSDESDDDSCLEIQSFLMSTPDQVDTALLELNNEYQLLIQEEIRHNIYSLEAELVNENQKLASADAQIERYAAKRQEADRKLDFQYQRKVAEGLDSHLTYIQSEHERKSQMEERRLYEEAKKKEKILQEERERQKKAKAEAEMQAKRRAEEAKKAAIAAEMRAAKEAAERKKANEKEAVKNGNLNAAGLLEGQKLGTQNTHSSLVLDNQSTESVKATKKPESAGDTVRCSESGLLTERERLAQLKEFDERNQSIRASANVDFSRQERHIGRLVRQIRGTKENVNVKAAEIVSIIKSPECPQSISISAFIEKVVSRCASPDNAPFACSYVIVQVMSQFPHAMNLLLAGLHSACIYTVPKHVVYSESTYGSREAYYKAIGYREDNGKLESTENYLKRVESYMKLYGALVQNEIGVEEGWAWLARFLNVLPANTYTAVALYAFLQTAGFGLHKRYRTQFRKLLNIISEDFVTALRGRNDRELAPVITEIQSYVEDKKFLKEPEGRTLQDSLLSSVMVPELDRSSYGYY